MYLYRFDQPWVPRDILRLAALGKLDYYTRFPRPFFRLCGARGLQMKGIEGQTSCRVVVSAEFQERFRLELDGALHKP